MTTKVYVHRGRIMVGDREVSLLSGAVHYWRLHPQSWTAVLRSVKDLGLETIDTYIPWEFHEIRKNEFDFTGETDSRRNLLTFMQLTRKMGLWIIARPGPFIYSEWVNMGIPTDVAGYHRLHKQFTARAREYIRAVSEVLIPFQASRGGHIILLQSDNETDTFEYCYEEQLGLGTKPGLFQKFLRGKYGDIERLNARWGTTYTSFEQARPVMSSVNLTPEYHIRYLDFFEFRADYINQCVHFYAEVYRRNGFDIPIMHNTYDVLNVQDFRGLSEVVDLVGADSYPSNEFRSKKRASGEQTSQRRFAEIFRYLRTFSETAYLAEYESGIGHGLHYYTGVLTPNQYTLTFLTAIQAGIHALNWYMLVNRDNWMMCPINEWGRKNQELFRVYAENTQLYKEMDVPDLEKLTDTSAFFYLGHQAFQQATADSTMIALYDSGIDYELYNIETGKIKKPLLFYAGSNWLPRSGQEQLLRYVQEGGNLVFFQTHPLYDENWVRHDGLGLNCPDRVTNEPFLDHLATETEVDLKGATVRTRAPFYVFDQDVSGEPIYGTRVDADIPDTDFEENQYLRSLVIGHRYVVGYREKRGAGSITVLGVRPSGAIITAIHNFLGIPIYLSTRAETVKTALFRREEYLFAVLLNLGDYPVHAPLDLSPHLPRDSGAKAISLRAGFTVDDRLLGEGRLYVDIPRKEGTVVKISQS